jgi:hypothetical protein
VLRPQKPACSAKPGSILRFDGNAHASGGGDAAFPYNDPQPPDATALIGAFVADQVR